MKGSSSPVTLQTLIGDFVEACPDEQGVRNWWRSPLLVTAPADERFEVLPQIVADDHLFPRDLLPGARSVIAYFIPFSRELAKENHPGTSPCRSWGLAYNDTNTLITRINRHIADRLSERGYRTAVTPPTADFDRARLVSRWSHKHVAHLAGLGRFGLHTQLITPRGCTGRLGSLVTTAPFEESPLIGAEEPCLHKRGRNCMVCIDRCPAEALQTHTFDRHACWDRLRAPSKHPPLTDLPEHTQVCGKCQVTVPCSFRVPK